MPRSHKTEERNQRSQLHIRSGSKQQGSQSRRSLGVQKFSRANASLKAMKKEQGTSLAKKSIIGILVAVVLLLGLGGVAVALYLHHISTDLGFDPSTEASLQGVLTSTDMNSPFYTLIIGSDARKNDPALGHRSDTIILARLDPINKKVTELSIPRDLVVTIPGHGQQKINAAFAFGAEAGITTQVEQLCGVQVSHYVEIDFTGLQNLIDKIGGITINVSKYQVPHKSIEHHSQAGETSDPRGVWIKSGTQTMDGFTAMAFARCRNYPDGDYQRMKNQQEVISAIARKVLDQNVMQLPSTVGDLATCVKTDMTATDLVALALKFQGLSVDNDIYTATVPSDVGSQAGLGSIIVVNQTAFNTMMQRIKAGLTPTADAATDTTASTDGDVSNTKSSSTSGGGTATSSQ
ncbi:MAG: LCP family protein [Coriobacteriales bacterium]|nr:LCP family protein [Coriobacteriales bacterium]